MKWETGGDFLRHIVQEAMLTVLPVFDGVSASGSLWCSCRCWFSRALPDRHSGGSPAWSFQRTAGHMNMESSLAAQLFLETLCCPGQWRCFAPHSYIWVKWHSALAHDKMGITWQVWGCTLWELSSLMSTFFSFIRLWGNWRLWHLLCQM